MLRLLFGLVYNLLVAILYPLFWLRRRRAAPRGTWLVLEVDGPIVEMTRKLPFWDRRPRALSLVALRRALDVAAEDPNVVGLVVRLQELRAASATATGLRDVLLAARRRGKRVVVHLPYGAGTRQTFVASAADVVLVGPETHIAPLGFAVGSAYLKRALDKAGVEPEVMARGQYKTAGEPLLLEKMSAPQREQLVALLDAAWDVLVEGLATGRGVDRARAEAWVHEAPWSAKAAVSQGIADAVVYDDEVKTKLDPTRPNGPPLVSALRYARRKRIPWLRIRRPPRIAVVEVLGPIVSRHVGPFPVAAEDQIHEALERAMDDRRIRGAVLHVDSRGGSALASDRILRAVRRLAEKKPVVAFLGDVAASGGYMAAVGAHCIVAQPNTLTGSIGVVSARFVIAPLLQRIGIAVEVVKRGDRADMNSLARHLAPHERSVIDRELDDVYKSFLEAVAVGRKRAVAEIEPLAGGRVWSGRDAAQHGLVDRLGGFDVALAEVRTRIGPGAERLEPVIVGPRHVRSTGFPVGRLLDRLRVFGIDAPSDLVPLALSAPRERVWAWAEHAEMEL